MPHRPHMPCTEVSLVYPREGVAVIEFTGEHDMTTQSNTRLVMSETLLENDLVVLDLSKALFIDSSFIHSIILIDKKAKESGKHIRLQLGTEPIVERVLELSGVFAIVDRVHTREEALE